MLHLAQVIHPLHSLVKKEVNWDWTPTLEQVFLRTKRIIKCTQALNVVDPARPSKLDVHVTQGGFGWGMWQPSEWLH